MKTRIITEARIKTDAKDCELKILVAMMANPYADCKECKIQGPCPDLITELKKYRKK